jgi:fibrillarin-like pre-rRNA processing protein
MVKKDTKTAETNVKESHDDLKIIFDGVYRLGKRIATRNLTPGYTVYSEDTVTINGVEYRVWDPYRSKLAAAIIKGLKELPIKSGSSVLYLGAASGTTSSHISDIVGQRGVVYCVEFAPRVMHDLLSVCEKRENMIPIFEDARKPELYSNIIKEKVDCIYEDVAQPDQVRILMLNAEKFLKKNGIAMIAIKSQSIDVTLPPKEVYRRAIEELEQYFTVLEKLELEPFEKDHLFVILRKK